MPDSNDDARAAVLARYRQLCADHSKAQENVEVVQAHQRELMIQINDCFAAARLFDFDLVAAFRREAQGDSRQPTLRPSDPITPDLFPVPAIPVMKAGPSVKTLVLEAAEQAHPKPVRAADVRRALMERGHAIHEKTVGMTLYRWSLDGCTRRVGRDWYFIPPDQRPTKINGTLNGTRSAADIAHARTH